LNPRGAGIVASIKRDSISALVRSEFRVDIIQRLSMGQAKPDYVLAFNHGGQAERDDSLLSEQTAHRSTCA